VKFPARLASAAVVLLALAAGIWLQAQVLLGPDVGWLIRSVRLMANGAQFGAQVFEPNLPVAWYLCRPAAWAVEYFGLTEVNAIRLWVWLLAAAALFAARACLLAVREAGRETWLELGAAAVAGCVLVGASFGQREHLAFLLSLPWLFAIRLRWDGIAIPARHAIVAGLAAGIAFSIKPVFVIVPIVVELALFARRRGSWTLLRPEVKTMTIAGAVCALVTLVLSPAYLSQVVPAAFATYWAYDLPVARLLEDFPVVPAMLVGWLVAWFADFRIARSSGTWLAAFLAWTASYFVQGRGFDYQGFPAMASAFVLSVSAIAQLSSGQARAKQLVAIAAVALTTWPTLDAARLSFAAATEPDWPMSRSVWHRELTALMREHGVGPGKSVFVFSTNPSPAFPALNYLGADWVGPDVAQFLLPAWVRRVEIADPEHRAAIDAAMTVQRRHVHDALIQGRPDYLLVSRMSRSASPQGAGSRRLDYFAIFGTDPALAEAFNRYQMAADWRGVQLYVRKAGE